MDKKKKELQMRHLAILAELDKIDEQAQRENRALTEEETQKYDSLMREDKRIGLELQGMLTDTELAKYREQKSKSAILREFLKRCVDKRENASTILMNAVTDGEDQNLTANLEENGAIPLTIHELIDTKVEGLELPADLKMLTGVVGNEVWPYSIDDVQFTVAGEVEKIDEQALNFAKLSATPDRVAASVAVSHRAIDNADFDLLGFVTYKLQKGWAKFKAIHVYSHAKFNNNLKSPFAQVDVEDIKLDNDFAKNLAAKIAEIADLGFEGVPTITVDKVTEALLKFTPKIAGDPASGTVIENGELAGFPYTTSRYINTKLGAGGQVEQEKDRYIGIGHYGYLAMEQHGEVRFNVDAQSSANFDRGTVVLGMSTDMSLTELSQKVNGNKSGKPQAFKLLKIVNED
ncbi:MAG: hypothetical protein J1E37_06115 [Prevotella sp.]|nr:hypothetical protein [Prevotella sp.]